MFTLTDLKFLIFIYRDSNTIVQSLYKLEQVKTMEDFENPNQYQNAYLTCSINDNESLTNDFVPRNENDSLIQNRNLTILTNDNESNFMSPKKETERVTNCIQIGNLLEIVPENTKFEYESYKTEDQSLLKNMGSKIVAENNEKKRLEKKMRKEKLKSEIKKLVSIGVIDVDISSEEDGPFDDIVRKGMYGTKDQGILRTTGTK